MRMLVARLSRLGAGPQIVVAILLVGLVGAMAIQPTRQLLEQRRRISDMSEQLRAIEDLNSSLEARVERLKDPDFIEQRARAQAGLVRPGETTFVVMPPSKKKKAKEQRRKDRARRAQPEPEPNTIQAFLEFVGL